MILPIDTILLFASIIMVASLSPGPNVMLVINHSIQFGVRKVFPTIFGNLFCLLCIAFLAAFGVGAILQASPILFNSLKLLGGMYLLYIGIMTFRIVTINGSTEERWQEYEKTKIGIARFWEAFMVSASNPKSILFLASVFPAFINPETSLPQQFAVLFTVIIIVVSSIHFGYAALASTLKNVISGIDFRLWIARISGLVFIVFGCVTMVLAFAFFYGGNT
ncbi:MAG: LysE family translocator [Sedimenticola sp.]